MKSVLVIILFFTFGLTNYQVPAPGLFKISTFKNVPDEMMGCGDDCYLSEKDKKNDVLICRTDYASALIYLNNKPLVLKADQTIKHESDEETYRSGKYALILKKVHKKKEGDEYYIFKGSITVRLAEKIIFQQKITGDGGC